MSVAGTMTQLHRHVNSCVTWQVLDKGQMILIEPSGIDAKVVF